MEPRKEQALRCLPERICRGVLCACQSFWWAVKSHQGTVIREHTPVKTHMVLVKAGGNWIKEILLETVWIVLAITTVSSWHRQTTNQPETNIMLLFFMSSKSQQTERGGERGTLLNTFSSREVRSRKGLWPGFNSLLHFFPQQNALTAPYAFHQRDVIPPLAAGDLCLVNSPSEKNHLSQHQWKKLTGVYVTSELDHIHHFAWNYFLSGVIKALRQSCSTGPRPFLLSD